MKRNHQPSGLIDLGRASTETKGGPWGVDDYRGTLMLADQGLSPDEDVIDLGSASAATKGTPFGSDDHKAGLIPVGGLSNE